MVIYVLYLLAGLAGAWLINYLSDVLPVYRKFMPLRCPSCQEERGWIAYLSYSRCSHCGTLPTLRHLIVLLIVPALSVIMGIFPMQALGSLGSILWLVYFTLIVVIDLEHRLILHPISLVGAGMGIIYGTQAHGLPNTLLGGGAGFGIMLLFYLLGEGFVRMLSRRRGEQIDEVALGFGDVNLAGIMGLLLGWPGVIGGIFLAVILGGIVSGAFLIFQLIRKEYQAFQALPYGPFLAVSTLIMFYLAALA